MWVQVTLDIGGPVKMVTRVVPSLGTFGHHIHCTISTVTSTETVDSV